MKSIVFLACLSALLMGGFGMSFAFAEPAQDEMMTTMSTNHHMTYNGMCAPGFASLDGLCVLDDRCGPGAYKGRLCVIDGEMKPYLRPLHQKYAGISADNIICVEGKQVMFKHHNASPACVNFDSVEKLESRGWQTEKPNLSCTMEYMPICGVDGITYGNTCSLHSNHMVKKHVGPCVEPSIDTLNVVDEIKTFDVVLSESVGLTTP